MIIGITGLIGSGRSEITKLIIKNYKNCEIVNDMKLYSILLKKNNNCYKEIIETFGSSLLLNKDKQLTQFALTTLALKGSETINKLNTIMGKYSLIEIEKLKIDNPTKIYIIDMGLLIDYKLTEICDKIVVTTASSNTRAQRLSESMQIPYEQAYKQISIQKPIEHKSDKCLYISTDNINEVKNKLLSFINS